MSVINSRVYMAPVPKMPPGLIELMENLAKDVLKNNPTDVYQFCAEHMKKILDIRDSTTPKRILTLEQKIATAQKKVKERAALRRVGYIEKPKLNTEPEISNEGIEEIKTINKSNEDAEQYNQEKIIKLSEVVLTGNVEHEIIIKVEENPSLETMDGAEIEIENTTTVTKMDEISKQNSLNTEVVNISNDINNVSDLNSNKFDKYGTVEEGKKNLIINHSENIVTIDGVLENAGKAEMTPVNTHIENATNTHESPNNGDTKENDVIVADVENNGDAIINVTIFVSDHKDLQKVTKETESAIMEPSKEHITANVINTPYISTRSVDHDKIINNEAGDQTLVTPNNNQNNTENYAKVSSPKENGINVKLQESQNQANNTSMDLETAAITIQKVFRSFLFRNKTLSTDDATNVDIHLLIEDKGEKGDTDNSTLDRRVLGLSRMDTVLQTVNEEKSLSLSTDDSSTLSSAATIIQAHVRGFLVRNKFHVNKNSSTTSGVDSEGLSVTSLEGENDQRKNKTILNIHIVPESGHFISRDESIMTSMELSLDSSPTSSKNLHPLGQETSERRKQLKREDAIQSISPPSNNSGKLSEDVDSVKEVLINNDNITNEMEKQDTKNNYNSVRDDKVPPMNNLNDDNISTMVNSDDIALEVKSLGPIDSPVKYSARRPQSLPEMTSDEMDVITPYTPVEEKKSRVSDNDTNLLHSGEFHDVLLPTKVIRSNSSVVRGE